MLKIRKQRESLSGSEAACAGTRASTPLVAAGGAFARGACNWRAAAFLQGRLEQAQLIAPEVSLASSNQQAALV